MSQSCVRHPMLRAAGACGQCGHLFCGECLVHAFGPQRPPMCRACALSAAGVRQRRAALPKVQRRTRRERRRQPVVVDTAAAATDDRDAVPTHGGPTDGPPDDTRSDEERWLAGDLDDVPGGWRQVF